MSKRLITKTIAEKYWVGLLDDIAWSVCNVDLLKTTLLVELREQLMRGDEVREIALLGSACDDQITQLSGILEIRSRKQ